MTNTKTESLTVQDLALYLGCDVRWDNATCFLIGVHFETATATIAVPMADKDGHSDGDEHIEVDPSEVKPILRPLSDMNANLFCYGWNKILLNDGMRLIRQGFDVFGWLDKGLATRKTTPIGR